MRTVPARSLVGLLRERAADGDRAAAYRFLRDGLEVADTLTHAELDRRARAGAALLRPHVAPGDRVLLAYPPGLEFLVGFFGALYAGAVPVPAYPPRGQGGDLRLRAIAADAQPSAALSTADVVARAGGRLDTAGAPLPCLSLDAARPEAGDDWHAPPDSAAGLAHLQYTSGSTAVPRGVMVTHANVLANLADLDEGWRHEPGSTIVSWLPAFHDMGLVYGLLMPIYARISCVLMPPVVFLQRPIRWLQAIDRFGGTHAAAPNFAYDHCVRRVKPEEAARLDLSRWEVAVNGAEPVRPATLDRFCEAFAPAGFRRRAFAPGYGLAEATLKVTAARRAEGPATNTTGGRTLVACGAAGDRSTVAIVGAASSEELPEGETGEIWVAGPGVAAGYWRRPEESAAVFEARTRDGRGPFLRTGDLGFTSGGQLYVAGRLKDLIIIRGQNYYPQDIEATVEQSGARIRPGAGAAFSVERDGEERLVVVYEIDRGLRPDGAAAQVEAIRAAIAREHDLHAEEVALLAIGGAARTSSGKIQRRACREAFLDGTLPRWPGQDPGRAAPGPQEAGDDR